MPVHPVIAGLEGTALRAVLGRVGKRPRAGHHTLAGQGGPDGTGGLARLDLDCDLASAGAGEVRRADVLVVVVVPDSPDDRDEHHERGEDGQQHETDPAAALAPLGGRPGGSPAVRAAGSASLVQPGQQPALGVVVSPGVRLVRHPGTSSRREGNPGVPAPDPGPCPGHAGRPRTPHTPDDPGRNLAARRGGAGPGGAGRAATPVPPGQAGKQRDYPGSRPHLPGSRPHCSGSRSRSPGSRPGPPDIRPGRARSRPAGWRGQTDAGSAPGHVRATGSWARRRAAGQTAARPTVVRIRQRRERAGGMPGARQRAGGQRRQVPGLQVMEASRRRSAGVPEGVAVLRPLRGGSRRVQPAGRAGRFRVPGGSPPGRGRLGWGLPRRGLP